jgi:major membrane immunogen (membrane-anchored lipoprotein)
MMDKVTKDHQEEKKKRGEGAHNHVRDLLDILLEIQEDESNEIKLTSENVNAFILVNHLAYDSLYGSIDMQDDLPR